MGRRTSISRIEHVRKKMRYPFWHREYRIFIRTHSLSGGHISEFAVVVDVPMQSFPSVGKSKSGTSTGIFFPSLNSLLPAPDCPLFGLICGSDREFLSMGLARHDERSSWPGLRFRRRRDLKLLDPLGYQISLATPVADFVSRKNPRVVDSQLHTIAVVGAARCRTKKLLNAARASIKRKRLERPGSPEFNIFRVFAQHDSAVFRRECCWRLSAARGWNLWVRSNGCSMKEDD